MTEPKPKRTRKPKKTTKPKEQAVKEVIEKKTVEPEAKPEEKKTELNIEDYPKHVKTQYMIHLNRYLRQGFHMGDAKEKTLEDLRWINLI